MARYVRCALISIVIAGCGPADVVPSGATHPGDPRAPAGAGAPVVAGTEPEPEPKPAPDPDPVPDPDPDPDPDDPAAIAAAEKAAIDKAMPIFRAYCARCHAAGNPKASKDKLAHFDMSSYPFRGHHADELGKTIREVLGLAGEKATMPANDPGAVKGEELEIIRAWTEAFDRAHAAGLHGKPDDKGHDHGHHGHH